MQVFLPGQVFWSNKSCEEKAKKVRKSKDLSQFAETVELSSSEVMTNWLLFLINIKDNKELQHAPPLFPCCSCLLKIPVTKGSKWLWSKKIFGLK